MTLMDPATQLMSFEADVVDEDALSTHCAELCVQEREAREDQEPLQRWWAELGVPEKEKLAQLMGDINRSLMDLVTHKWLRLLPWKCGSCKYFRNAAFNVHKNSRSAKRYGIDLDPNYEQRKLGFCASAGGAPASFVCLMGGRE